MQEGVGRVVFPVNCADTTYLYNICVRLTPCLGPSQKDRHRRTVREEQAAPKPLRSSSCWLLTSNDVAEDLQAPPKGEGEGKIFCQGDNVLKSLPRFFPCHYPCRFSEVSRLCVL